MPISTQEYRIKTGLFYFTHGVILQRKLYKKFKGKKSRFSGELCVWGSCLGLILFYSCLLLILSNDVETNPGPDMDTQLSSPRCYHTCMEYMERGWSNIHDSMKANAAFLHYDLGSKLQRMECLLNFMNHGLNELKAVAKENTNTINILKSNHKDYATVRRN